MKKIIYLFLVMTFSLVSCQKDEVVNPVKPEIPVLEFTLNGQFMKFSKDSMSIVISEHEYHISASNQHAFVLLHLSSEVDTIVPGVYTLDGGWKMLIIIEKCGIRYVAGKNPNRDGFIGAGSITITTFQKDPIRGFVGKGSFEFSSGTQPEFRVENGYFEF